MASNGREILQLWQRGLTFDVMLSDVNMPHLDGCHLAGQLRNVRAKTPGEGGASALAEAGERCLAAGMGAYLVKPASQSKSAPSILLTLNRLQSAMRDLFILTAKEDWSAMTSSFADGNTIGVIEHAHRLKGSFATIGDMDAAYMCSDIEAHAQVGRQIDEQLKNLAQYLSPILEVTS
ncbi:CheY-like chemotaxis protein [Pseudomonas sp. 210_17 TE3656]